MGFFVEFNLLNTYVILNTYRQLKECSKLMKMRSRLLLSLIIISITCLFIIFLANSGLSTKKYHYSYDRLAGLPRVVLWAWERPEDLNFIDPRDIGIAYLAKTLFLRGDNVYIRPRLQPIRPPQGAALIAVVRIESSYIEKPSLSPDQRNKVASAILDLRCQPEIIAIQVDFDSKSSERNFYREMLFNIRHQIPQSMGLSITALASWCIYDNWIQDLPIDEAIPMLFRMGTDSQYVQFYLNRGNDFTHPLCRQSLGLSTSESFSRLPKGRRLYFFHPKAWSPDAVLKTMKEARKWQ
jgi:hypothetical protein